MLSARHLLSWNVCVPFHFSNLTPNPLNISFHSAFFLLFFFCSCGEEEKTECENAVNVGQRVMSTHTFNAVQSSNFQMFATLLEKTGTSLFCSASFNNWWDHLSCLLAIYIYFLWTSCAYPWLIFMLSSFLIG